MKKLLGILVIIALCTLSVSALAAGDTVTATGSATVILVPDMATFSIGVTTQATLIATAQAANNAAMQAIIAALTSLGVAPEDLQTDQYSIYPVYDYQDYSQTVKGYEISNTITVTVRALDQAPSLLDAAVEAGANTVYSLGFQSSQEDAAYEQALKAAAQDALRKAALMAQAIGREAGGVLSLAENTNISVSYSGIREYSLDSSYATPIESGTITVTAEVVAVVQMN
ncbi:MAG: SIMPL domain-containing protein [Clostridiales bacterium]|nr:SIMPL domain-containing protein [Clostridiales bacterium]